jgi:O-antigen ligase
MYGYLLSMLMTYPGSAVALFQPLVGLTIYAIFSLARPQQIFAFAGDLRGISNIVGIATLIGWFLKGLGSWSFGRAKPYAVLLIGFFVMTCASAIFASNQEVAWAYVEQRLKIVLMFFVGLTLFDSMTWIRRFAWALVVAQGYVGFEMNLSYVQGFNVAAMLGLLGDNNTFAISMVGGLGPAIFLGLAAPRLWQKAVAFTCAALILHTVLLTFSRGGMVALCISGIFVLILMPKKPTLLLALVVAALLTYRLAGPELTERFMTAFAETEDLDASASSRLLLWEDCLEVVRSYPILGIGPNHFPLIAHEFGWPRGKSAHSLWLQGAAELGLPAILCLLGFNLLGVWHGIVLARRHKNTDVGLLGLYVFSGMAGFIISAQFVSAEGLELPYFNVLIMAAVVRLQSQESAAPAASPASAPVAQPMPQWAGRTP